MKNEEGEIMPTIQQSFESPITEAANLSAAFTPQSHFDSVQKKLDFTSQPNGSFSNLNNGWMNGMFGAPMNVCTIYLNCRFQNLQ
jgi:hypothetical protein